MARIKTPLFQLGREDFRRGEPRPSHYPGRARGWDFEHRHGARVAEIKGSKGPVPYKGDLLQKKGA